MPLIDVEEPDRTEVRRKALKKRSHHKKKQPKAAPPPTDDETMEAAPDDEMSEGEVEDVEPQAPPRRRGLNGPEVLGDRAPDTNIAGPQFKQKAVLDAADAITNLNRAWKLLHSAPGAYGAANQVLGGAGAVAGGLPGVGGILGPITQSVTQRLMPGDERRARYDIAAMTDQAIKAISGAQVSHFEELRKNYLPREYDSMPVVEDKLRSMLARAIRQYRVYGGADDVSMPAEAGDADRDMARADALVRKYLTPGQQPEQPASQTMMRSH